MNTFYFVRHAHAEWSPDENRPLSKRGKRDAILVADVLQEYPISHIFSSPYPRAYQTIVPYAERNKIEIQLVTDLRERVLSARPPEDFLEAVRKTWLNPEFSHPGGESISSVQKRGLGVLSKLIEQFSGEHIALSTHGNLMAATLQRFDRSIDFSFWGSMTFPDIYILAFSRGGPSTIVRIWHPSGLNASAQLGPVNPE